MVTTSLLGLGLAARSPRSGPGEALPAAQASLLAPSAVTPSLCQPRGDAPAQGPVAEAPAKSEGCSEDVRRPEGEELYVWVRAHVCMCVCVRARAALRARVQPTQPQAPKLRSSPLSEGAGSHGERSGWAMTQKAFPF